MAGDPNDTPDSEVLASLLNRTDLREVSAHPDFDARAVPSYSGPPLVGTYGSGTPKEFDYLLLSPALYQKLTKSGIFRKGVWTGSPKAKWEGFDKRFVAARELISDEVAKLLREPPGSP